MEILNVGDKIVWVNNYFGEIYYTFDEVERITPMHTQAVTKAGRKFKRESVEQRGKICFSEIGARKLWQRVTPEIIAEAKAEKRRQDAANWFRSHKFTDAEKLEIFERYGGQDLKPE